MMIEDLHFMLSYITLSGFFIPSLYIIPYIQLTFKNLWEDIKLDFHKTFFLHKYVNICEINERETISFHKVLHVWSSLFFLRRLVEMQVAIDLLTQQLNKFSVQHAALILLVIRCGENRSRQHRALITLQFLDLYSLICNGSLKHVFRHWLFFAVSKENFVYCYSVLHSVSRPCGICWN